MRLQCSEGSDGPSRVKARERTDHGQITYTDGTLILNLPLRTGPMRTIPEGPPML